MSKVYRHKKTGNLYELVQEKILFKDIVDEEYEYDIEGRPTTLLRRDYGWRGKDAYDQLVLYKALYDNPDGPYFVRHMDDFNYEFEKVEE